MMFDPIKVETVPKQGELYHWADFVEVLCMTDVDGEFSADRLARLAKFAEDLSSTSPDAQDSDLVDLQDAVGARDSDEHFDYDSLADELDQDADATAGTEEVAYEDYGRDAELKDDRRRWAEDIFRLLSDREKHLGDVYPFAVAADRTISTRELTQARLNYVFFLCCSSLASVPPGTMRELTRNFEVVSSAVLRSMLPSSAEVDVFGTARGSAESRFAGHLHQRILRLAEAMRAKVIVSENDFHPIDLGDNGLDLVAWVPMKDNQPGLPTFLAQCACGTGWKGKQAEASYTHRWHNFIHLTVPATTLTFIPYYFRKVGGHWYADSDVETVLVDRLRALRFLEQITNFSVPAALVQQAWAFRRQVT